MNKGLPDDDPCYQYYDGDYPSLEVGEQHDTFLDLALRQGIAYDVPRYAEIARVTGGPVLEVGCGNGRVAIPLARRGLHVTGVDIAEPLLAQLHHKLGNEPADVAGRVTLHHQDATEMALPAREFRLALMPFNGFLLLDGLEAQLKTLRAIHAHLVPNGHLVIDVVNPLVMPLVEQSTPVASAPRLNGTSGNIYQKFALSGRMDEEQRQPLYGWYDEILPGGIIRRSHYAYSWRLVFRFELEFMLKTCGFVVDALQGGHASEPYLVDSPRMVVLARRI